MAIPSTGEIHFKGLHNEKNEDNYDSSTTPSGPVTMYDLIHGGNVSGSTISYDTINVGSTSYPNTSTPHAIDEWYSYDHDTAAGPQPPTSLGYTATSTSTITYTWSASGTTTRTYMYVSGGGYDGVAIYDPAYVDVSTTSRLVGDGDDMAGSTISLSPNEAYAIKLKGYNGGSYSDFSSPITGYTKPGTPGSLSESGIDHDSITINWAAPAGGASSYKIYAGDSGTMTSNTLSTGNTGTSKTYNSLTPNTQYNWWIAAVGTGGDVGAYSSMQSGLTLPGVPTNLHEDNIASTSVTLDWDAPSAGSVDSYDIFFGTSYYSQSNAVTSSISPTTQAVSGLSAATTYYWSVRASGDNDDKGVYATQESFATSAASTTITGISDFTISASAGGNWVFVLKTFTIANGTGNLFISSADAGGSSYGTLYYKVSTSSDPDPWSIGLGYTTEGQNLTISGTSWSTTHTVYVRFKFKSNSSPANDLWNVTFENNSVSDSVAVTKNSAR